MAEYKSDYERPYKTKPFRDRSADVEDKAKFLELLQELHGNIYAAYTQLGIPYTRFYEWRKTDTEFSAEIDKIKLDTVRWVEDKMFEAIAKGDKDLMKFYLKTHKDGQKLGYLETKKIEADVKGYVDVEQTLEDMASQLDETPF